MPKFTFKPHQSFFRPHERTISFDEHLQFRNIIRALANEIDTDKSVEKRPDVTIAVNSYDFNLLIGSGCEWFYGFEIFNRAWNDRIGRLECQHEFFLVANFSKQGDRGAAESFWKLMS